MCWAGGPGTRCSGLSAPTQGSPSGGGSDRGQERERERERETERTYERTGHEEARACLSLDIWTRVITCYKMLSQANWPLTSVFWHGNGSHQRYTSAEAVLNEV